MGRRLLLPSFVAARHFGAGTVELKSQSLRRILFLSNDPQVFRAIGEGSYFLTGRANLNGWNVSGEVKVFHWVGLVAGFNGTYGSIPIRFISMPPPTTVDTDVYTYPFGPRVSVQIGRVRPLLRHRFEPIRRAFIRTLTRCGKRIWQVLSEVARISASSGVSPGD